MSVLLTTKIARRSSA